MSGQPGKNSTIYISSKTHLNLTFNLCQCGTNELLAGGRLALEPGDTFSLMMVTRGTGLLETGGLAFKVSQGQGYFSFPDMGYELQNLAEGPLEVVWLCFTGYLVENYLNRANIFRTKPVFTDKEDIIIENFLKLYRISQKLPNRYCKMASILYQIFSDLLDMNPTKEMENYVDNSAFYAVKAVEYIELNYAKNITIDEIAAALGITRKHLYSIFNSNLKIPPKQYIIYYRIEKACKRLKATNQSVMEISESVGYANQFYFAKEFKRLTGMTPTQYRANPDVAEIFSYRSFVATLKETLEDPAMELPMMEDIASVYLPPIPVGKGQEKQK